MAAQQARVRRRVVIGIGWTLVAAQAMPSGGARPERADSKSGGALDHVQREAPVSGASCATTRTPIHDRGGLARRGVPDDPERATDGPLGASA